MSCHIAIVRKPEMTLGKLYERAQEMIEHQVRNKIIEEAPTIEIEDLIGARK
jgi:hypothetical protein